MDPRDDVEFLVDDGTEPAPDDDVVDFGRVRVPGRVVLLAGLVIAALLGTFVIARGHSNRPLAASTPASGGRQPVVVAPPPSGAGPALTLGSGNAFDAVTAGDSFYALYYDRFTVLNSAGRTDGPYSSTLQVSLDALDQSEATQARLVLDPAGNRLWVVVMGVARGKVLEFDAATLSPLRQITWADPITATAAMGGHLYLAGSASGVADWSPGARAPRPMPGLPQDVAAIAADPTRNRLLVIDVGNPTHVWSYRPHGSIIEAPATLPFGLGSLGVTVDGAIWAGGFGDKYGRAVLLALNPVTLAPTGFSSVAAELGPGAVIVAAGSADIWVRSGADSNGLWCASGRSGEQLQHWQDAPGTVTSHSGAAFETDAVVRPLILAGCTG